MVRAIAGGVMALLLATAGGCDIIRFMAYTLAPPAMEKTVPAEFDLPGDRTVAVVIYCDDRVKYSHAPEKGLSSAISAELERQIAKSRTVPPARVVKFQEQNFNWDLMPKPELARALGADYLLYVVVSDYSTQEPGGSYLYRGRITAQTTLYASKETGADQGRLWTGRTEVVFPPNGPVGVMGASDEPVRIETNKVFATQLVKKFYKHKEQAS